MSNPGHPIWQAPARPFGNEAELADWACGELDPFFEIRRQIQGTHCTGRRLRIDAILRPRDVTGWADPDPAFGVEFKNPGAAGTQVYTTWAAQCVDYTHTNWDGFGRLLIATCLPVTGGFLGRVDAEGLLVRVLGKLGVGELGISPSQGWALRVSGDRVWSQASGPRRNWGIRLRYGSR